MNNKIILLAVILFLFFPLQEVSASFCIFDCAAVDLKNRLQANADCIKDQIIALGYPAENPERFERIKLFNP